MTGINRSSGNSGVGQALDSNGNPIGVTVGGKQYALRQRSYNRPPDVTDNASVGYSINSIWQAGGRLYKPISAPDSNSATWALLPMPAGYFTDVAGANAIFAGGTSCAKSGYTGAAIDLTATISSSPVITTINILANGKLDNANVQSVLTKADSGTVVTVTKIYDQTGNGNHFVKSASYLAPFIEWDEIMGMYVICDLAGNSGTIRTLQIPPGVIVGGAIASGFGVIGNAYTLYAVGRGVNAADSGKAALIVVGDQTNPTTADRRSLTTMTHSNGYVNISKNGTNQVVVPKVAFDCQPTVVIARCGTDTTVISVNEDIGTVAATNGANDTAAYSGAWLNCITPASQDYHGSHRWTVIGIANAALTTAQQQQLRRAAYTSYDIRPQVMNQVFCIGDSRTAKIQQSTAQVMDNWPLQLTARIGRDWRVYGMGDSGQQALQMLTSQLPSVICYYHTGAQNIAFVLEGVNDISTANATPAQVQGYLQSACSQLKTAGFKTILFNELATTATSNNVNTQLPVLRGLIAAAGPSGMSADAIIDMLIYAPFTQPSNATFYPDGLHLSQGMDTGIASAALPYISIPQ